MIIRSGFSLNWLLRHCCRIAAAVICGLGPALAAHITTDVTTISPAIYLKGEIDAQTPTELEHALHAVQPRINENIAEIERRFPVLKGSIEDVIGPELLIDSPGGDVDAAIAAGTIARRHAASTFVAKGAVCASACVLLYIGGVSRLGVGQIGLHRAFPMSYSRTQAEAVEKYAALRARIARYLEAMNLPPRFWDAMNATSPDEIHWLDAVRDFDQLEELGVMGTAPVWQDRSNSVDALRRGISKAELYAVRQRGSVECRPLKDNIFGYLDCVQMIVDGKR